MGRLSNLSGTKTLEVNYYYTNAMGTSNPCVQFKGIYIVSQVESIVVI